MLADAGRVALLALLSLGGGLLLNSVRSHPVSLAYRTPAERLRASLSGVGASPAVVPLATPKVVGLNEFQAFVAAGKGLVVDARAEAFYAQGHVPGAVNLPRETFAAAYDAQKTALDRHRGEQIAIYCSDVDCPDGELVAAALAKLGFARLLVYKDGWDEWTQAGLPQQKSPAP